ncbi:MAG TPA: hypothetical protein VLB83_05480 [Candidatus Paceibacterota bacterium]|nr:hypothetical protein [Candidatus Paceibacterota bacterium]
MRSLSIALFLVLGCFAPASVLAHGGAVEEAAPAAPVQLHVPTQIGAEAGAMTLDPTFGLPRNMVFSAVQPVVKQEDERANIRYALLIAALGLLVAAHLPKNGTTEQTPAPTAAPASDQSNAPAV